MTRPKRRAVAYIRVATDKQKESAGRQRHEMERLAHRESAEVVEWYEDLGISGKEATKRSQFQRMMRDVEAGKLDALFMYEQSRFSREDVFDVMEHWRVLNRNKVTLITCQRGRLDVSDLGGLSPASWKRTAAVKN